MSISSFLADNFIIIEPAVCLTAIAAIGIHCAASCRKATATSKELNEAIAASHTRLKEETLDRAKVERTIERMRARMKLRVDQPQEE